MAAASPENRTMIARIAAELERDHAIWCDKVRAFELAAANSSAGVPSEEAETLQREVLALAVDIESYVAEINFLGANIDVRELFSENR